MIKKQSTSQNLYNEDDDDDDDDDDENNNDDNDETREHEGKKADNNLQHTSAVTKSHLHPSLKKAKIPSTWKTITISNLGEIRKYKGTSMNIIQMNKYII